MQYKLDKTIYKMNKSLEKQNIVSHTAPKSNKM